ncbi:MAG TPA: hypothetical protein VJ743_21115 [Albitalea sp.]|nr:hypothetical protein [Albitalea sp.]
MKTSHPGTSPGADKTQRSTTHPDPAGTHRPEPVDPAQESVAGEEDPGAALELDTEPQPPRRPASRKGARER